MSSTRAPTPSRRGEESGGTDFRLSPGTALEVDGGAVAGNVLVRDASVGGNVVSDDSEGQCRGF